MFFSFCPLIKADPNNTFYVGGTGYGNYTQIQYAIDNSSIGDTIYVYSGNYSENIVINHPIDLIGQDKNTTVIKSTNTSNVISILTSYVNITGFTIKNGYNTYGLIIDGDHNRVFENIFTNNFYGINIFETSINNIIYHNNFIMNIFGAIDLSNNKNQWDNGLEGNFWDDFYGGTDTDGDGIVDRPYFIIGQSDCKDKYPLINPWQQIYKKTVYVDDDYNSLTPGWGVDHFNNIRDGISMTHNTVYVYNGTYHENLFIDKAIILVGENKNTTIIDGGGNGDVVKIYAAYNLKISGFTIQNSGGYNTSGLVVWNAGYFNEITDNIFTNNYIGVSLKNNSFDNIIHHNLFMDNIYNAIDYTSCENQWDDGLEGNYWDDYKETVSYTIPGPYTCKDNYPLSKYIEPDNPPEENQSKIYCKNLGYLIDENNDETYDLFYSNQTGIKTSTQKQADGSYLINNDMDSQWDYIYNLQTDILTSYSSKTTSDKISIDDTMLFYIAIIVIILVILSIIVALKKKGKGNN